MNLNSKNLTIFLRVLSIFLISQYSSLALSDIQATGNGGVTFGGDRLETIFVEDDDGETVARDITAGELFFINFGALWRMNQEFKISTTLGWHLDQIDADPGNVEFSRFPLEFIPFYYPAENHRIGLGLTYHIAPRLNSTSPRTQDVEFKNALGLVFEYDTAIGANFFFGVRFAQIEYETEVTGQTFDGSYLGFVIGEGF